MFTKSFKQLSKNDVALAGGKGASLGEMTQAGMSVPPGFVVLSGAFERFIEETDLNVEIDAKLHKVDHNIMHTVEEASEKIQALILSTQIPEDIADEVRKGFEKLDTKYVAVRSSATAEDSSTAAWAGQLDSFLNTTEENLLENVRKCWASLFTPRAIFYRFEQNLHKQKISVAVVVQKMVESEKSGIAFSVHPVTQDRNQLIIEAGYGLGEAIVSGSITPDGYVVEKEPRRIIDKNINTQERMLVRAKSGGNKWQDIPKEKGGKSVFDDEQIMKLTDLILKIESHYKSPQDIEWAFEKGKFYITQSRPITTLTIKSIASPKRKKLTYIKTIERDTTLIMEEIFADVMIKDLKYILGIDPFKGPAYFYVTNDKNIVFYENLEFQKDLIEQIHIKISDDTFLKELEDIYEKSSVEVLKFWNKNKAKDIGEFKEYLNTSRNFILVVSVAYYGGLIESLNKKAHKLFLRIRSEFDFFATADEYVRNTFESMGIERDLINIIAGFEIDNLPNNTELEKRKKFGSVLYGGKLFEFTEGQTIGDIFPEYNFKVPVVDENVKEITGQVAESGVVRGVVRIIKNKHDSAQTKRGEVIVASMTTPDFLPAMQKASAFVTDEGGVTCHAAIISRELKKPCIIGTKIATQVLKDGDLVEVDADKGVVRILDKKH